MIETPEILEMAVEHGPDGWGWIQTTFASILGLFTVLFGGSMWHMNNRIDELAKDQTDSADQVKEKAEAGDQKLWEGILRLENKMDAHRKETESYRNDMLNRMVTKEDLHREIQHIIVLIRKET